LSPGAKIAKFVKKYGSTIADSKHPVVSVLASVKALAHARTALKAEDPLLQKLHN